MQLAATDAMMKNRTQQIQILTVLLNVICKSSNLIVCKLTDGKEAGFTSLLHARNYAETMPFCKISTPENQVKLRYFSK